MTTPAISQAKAPGKLFLAGEYAVVESRQTAILAAVDAFLTVTCRPSGDCLGRLTTNQVGHPLPWQHGRDFEVVPTTPAGDDFQLIWRTLEVVMQYAAACGTPRAVWRQALQIDIQSQLDHHNGVKIGLGSSAAVTVALVDALLQFFDIAHLEAAARKLLVFKLAVSAQDRLAMSGSYGDLAAASFTGVIFYQNFDRAWLAQQPKQTGADIQKLVERTWPGLVIRPLHLPPEWTLSVIWSESAASTAALLRGLPQPDPQAKAAFLAASKHQVDAIRQAIADQNFGRLVQAVTANFQTILNYTRSLGRPYMTPSFDQARAVAQDQQALFKVAGAGAGDCAYAISPNDAAARRLEAAWQARGLTVLPLKIWSDQAALA